MPNLTLSGVVLGINVKEYDFTDDAGKRVVGESNTLWLWDDEVAEPTAVKIPKDRIGLAEGLGQGEMVTLSVGLFARNNRVTYSFDRVLDAA